MKKFALVLTLSLFFLLSGCSFFGLFGNKIETKELTLQTQNKTIKLNVEIADSPEEREKGLMERDKLEEGKGMLFVFEDEAPRAFWMKNTLISLDVIFFNGRKEVIETIQFMKPCKEAQCPSYRGNLPAMYALEVPAGFVQEKGVKAGDTMVY